MCGRFIISKFPADVARWFGTTGPLPNSRPRYNAAPTQDMAVVRFDGETKARALDTLRWGLVPFWAKDVKIGSMMINAKSRESSRRKKRGARSGCSQGMRLGFTMSKSAVDRGAADKIPTSNTSY
jgi:putative SOS response-associated peptidase YedK